MATLLVDIVLTPRQRVEIRDLLARLSFPGQVQALCAGAIQAVNARAVDIGRCMEPEPIAFKPDEVKFLRGVLEAQERRIANLLAALPAVQPKLQSVPETPPETPAEPVEPTVPDAPVPSEAPAEAPAETPADPAPAAEPSAG